MNLIRKCMTLLAAIGVAMATPALAQDYDYPDNYAADRAEIEDLMARYLFAMDYGDLDAYVATFTPDGSIEFASGTFTGHAEIREAVGRFKDAIGQFYTTEDGSPAALRHVLLQSVVRVEGDRAWSTSLWMEMANDGPGDSFKMGTFGIYEDELVRVDGRWLFSRRVVLNEFLEGRESGPDNPVRDIDAAAQAYREATAE
ncbi:nuclear transport factor 2 family protein [Aurantiacibacter sp. MUD11]|uniref:nuclear transport factor 2 family protein n=1 Tax=Aurantiacibacter sp. MUD11 TaxID=3003265 RepID=UPI0022AA9D0C|nr:nuclear transport factor 2 family protein [Aurantiacibacter sp. MUD11]WAT17721.1 nuclear transport factor 2 family protein [Aurantiacibacter sp. MUD11]